jgi:hypothetical protein
VITQDSRLLRWKSPTIVGSAVDTIVWSSEARNMPSIRPDMIIRICRWVKPSLCSGTASGGTAAEAGEAISGRSSGYLAF